MIENLKRIDYRAAAILWLQLAKDEKTSGGQFLCCKVAEGFLDSMDAAIALAAAEKQLTV